jgi:DNA polymerase III delta prime subunit
MEMELIQNKYQPKFLNELTVNKDSDFVSVLNTLVYLNNLNILFIGDIGTGKTTLINCIINEYYKLYSKSLANENILYINSLKEQGINYYRNDVKIFCQTCSSIKDKKKIIIIDDIDQISEQSQQSFRNYIDKYSHNVNFIASCCNSQKVIEGLQSRLIIMKIKPLSKNNLKTIFKKITTNENISIDTESEEFILDICNNNAKMLLGYLEKIKLLNKHIDISLASNICTNISFTTYDKYTEYILSNNLGLSIQVLYNLYDCGYSVMDILDNYFLYVKFTSKLTENQKYRIIPIICKFIIVFHNVHEDEIELSIFTNNIMKELHSHV